MLTAGADGLSSKYYKARSRAAPIAESLRVSRKMNWRPASAHLPGLLALSQTQSVRWPDLVVLDIVMPGASGLKVLEFIRATPKLSPLPVVILTGHPSAVNRLER
jgi:CheY-like chemotaxis protein